MKWKERARRKLVMFFNHRTCVCCKILRTEMAASFLLLMVLLFFLGGGGAGGRITKPISRAKISARYFVALKVSSRCFLSASCICICRFLGNCKLDRNAAKRARFACCRGLWFKLHGRGHGCEIWGEYRRGDRERKRKKRKFVLGFMSRRLSEMA